jgi:hypothetical protein
MLQAMTTITFDGRSVTLTDIEFTHLLHLFESSLNTVDIPTDGDPLRIPPGRRHEVVITAEGVESVNAT